ncbi:SDR family NAD(P)-dependent oxidoreductase [Conexibacter sp. S30A1]|uniref:SDR family NAD(P)-dependent oxidoreductase n=1 Tax=Conexibacter sp. S30A1 TaxID=2937800 RepID=UPI002010BBC0|nr:SDR family oxidoreductase [Conexibacter sp. S30A1]
MNITVVTGAASGIGAATVDRLRTDGHAVLGIDVADSPLDADADRVAWIKGDVGSPETWSQAVQTTRSKFGGTPSGLVLSAARHVVGTILDTTPQQWNDVFETNVVGAYHGIRACLPGMREMGFGAIVTVASVDAFMAEQAFAAYCASKGALLQLTRAVALDYARDGIRANCVCPGVTDTPFFRHHLHSAEDPDSWLAARVARQPMGRLLDPTDVSNLIAFLLSDQASAMTGAMAVVDAGLSVGFDFR